MKLRITIFEHYDFWVDYLFETMFTLSVLSLGIYLLKNRKKKDKKTFPISLVFFGLLLLILTVLPKTVDIKPLISKDYEVEKGILEGIKIKRGSQSFVRTKDYETKLTINDENFYLNGPFKELNDFLGENMEIYYLPYSRKIMKINVIIDMRENQENWR